MNTLFNTMFENEEASHYQNGVYLRPRTYDLQESNVHLKLTIVDTVGFGDQINKEDRWAQAKCWSMMHWSNINKNIGTFTSNDPFDITSGCSSVNRFARGLREGWRFISWLPDSNLQCKALLVINMTRKVLYKYRPFTLCQWGRRNICVWN